MHEFIFWIVFTCWIILIAEWVQNDLMVDDEHYDPSWGMKDTIIMIMSYYVGFNYEFILAIFQ